MLVVQMKRCYPIQRFRSVYDSQGSQRERDTHHITLIGKNVFKFFFKDDKPPANFPVRDLY